MKNQVSTSTTTQQNVSCPEISPVCDSRAHNVRKVQVVKYIVVYGQIKAADQKYCHNQKWRRKLKEISFRTRGF